MPADSPPPSTATPGAASGLCATVKYNPHLWGPDELRSIFVARNRELEGLLERVRATADGSVPQHVLVTGSRGMGKTTLLRRLALALEDDPALARRWVALSFPEEQYTVSTLAELWRSVLDALADTRERQGAPAEELAWLDAAAGRIGELPPDQRETAALTSLGDWISTHGRRLLLLIDSTDLLLANLAAAATPKVAKGRSGSSATRAAGADGGATPLWRLRGTLTHEPGLFWLGASYQALETGESYQDAFWDFFERVELRPLQVAEMRAAMLALARTFGAGRGVTAADAERAMAQNLAARPERLKALRAITDGNPRTTVMLYELFAAGGADDVHTDLRRLLDTMTPIYKARMEALSDQARKLLAHLLEHWAPIPARDLGQVAGIPTNTVSGQLVRLEADGLVEKAALAGTRRTGYQASERLFNLWYLMRYAPRRLRRRLTWLVEFMRLWYGFEGAGVHNQGVAENDPSDPYPAANRARLLAAQGRGPEADATYRQAATLAQAADAPGATTTGPWVNPGLGHVQLLLQAHLWLGNRDLAAQALDRLAQAAAAGDQDAFLRLREQTTECSQIGLGPALGALMNAGAWAEFLQPFALALGAAAAEDPADALAGAPPELRNLAEEVLASLRSAGSVASGAAEHGQP